MPRSPPHRTPLLPTEKLRLPVPPPPGDQNDFVVVGIGASAGGLDACRKLLGGLHPGNGATFILIQHLDPTHESMMVDLLARYTSMTVRQAADGMRIERDHLYVIAPGTYLSVADGALRVSQPQARHGARLPFDYLLHSLATEFGARAICVILSGTGADGSLGLIAVKEHGGLVIAQDPDEAAFDGMPRSAIATARVDYVLSAEDIPQFVIHHETQKADAIARSGFARVGPTMPHQADNGFGRIIDLVRTKAAHDFSLYKPGTLRRRAERRMAMVGIEKDNVDAYLEILRGETGELDLLAKDLLINVTNFFRDPKVFDLLEEKIIPDLIRGHALEQPLRIWIAGCSTGEETYSLAMLFRERIAEVRSNVRLQIFASDVDPDAVASARDGLYPETIEADVSPARLARFFSREDHGYRVSTDLRSSVVFTVQDLLADAPFSRLDMVSCRNLLIYLRAEAQAKVVGLFHFALREDGILLLGGSETVGDMAGRFEVISRSERLFRRIGRSRAAEVSFPASAAANVPAFHRRGADQRVSRPAVVAELCRRLLIETYAPAAVVINRRNDCLYSFGATDTYLKLASGFQVHDVIAMAREGVRATLRSAILRAAQEKKRVVVAGGRFERDGAIHRFSVAAQPVLSEAEELLLICFIDEPKHVRAQIQTGTRGDIPRIAELEQELEATRAELLSAIRSLEASEEEQKTINEEAMSFNEEFQSTNEELLTSKEELQSLNEELNALNSQLQETLERQRATSNDLQNVLYSTNVATLFLDARLNIRFFTPATNLLFHIIPSDVGRPLADFNSLASDGALLTDAETVMKTVAPIEREIEATNGAWYIRRILPYRTQDNKVEGVVITFGDITERRQIVAALEAAERQAKLANAAKSRFLAAASHDLRQPLQTLSFVHAVLARKITERRYEEAMALVGKLDKTSESMSGMLNTLLDINEIEAGVIRAEIGSFSIDDLLERLKGEFAYFAEAQGLALHSVPCALSIRSDPRLLEQMIRNLLSNALKYTRRGKILLGCRRRGGTLSVEIWDTGIGIPDGELRAIFEEYHQIGDVARERSHGLGLGLSIVRRLGILLGHRIRVRSRLGKGSVFAIEVVRTPNELTRLLQLDQRGSDEEIVRGVGRVGLILVIEDDPDVRELLRVLLKDEGHRVEVAADGPAALELLVGEKIRPDLILADYNLPNGMDGLQISAKLREWLQREIPAIVLTGDISTETLRNIALANCERLSKPVKVQELTQVIRRLLTSQSEAGAEAGLGGEPATAAAPPVIFVIDDDNLVRAALCNLLETEGRSVQEYDSCEKFLNTYRPGAHGCVLVDAVMPDMDGFSLLQHLKDKGDRLPAIMITGNGDVPMAVRAMQAGASDFIEKPVGKDELLASIDRALKRVADSHARSGSNRAATDLMNSLTARQHQVMQLVLAGRPSKNIAADLHVSQRTVENHRAAIMKKTGSKSLPDLVRFSLAASSNNAKEPTPKL
jgi:two-component system, chemotaxis family, CheB/CheR fusion protein